MYLNPKITFTCVTYNRVKMLRNLLLSFSLANSGYDNFEWLILEHDTTDGTVDFLKNIHNEPVFDCLKGKIKIFYETDKDYLEFLDSKGIDISTDKKKAFSFFGKFRNDLVSHAQGEILIDFPDDHQFTYKGNFCQEIVDIFNDRIQRTGRDDIGTLTFRTRFLYRILKKINNVDPVVTTQNGTEYYIVNTHNSRDDWGAISRENFEKVGGYSQLENESDEVIEMWNNPPDGFFYFYHHLTMSEKTGKIGLKKLMTKIPIVNDCLDSKYDVRAIKDQPKSVFPILKDRDTLCFAMNKMNRCLAISEYESLLEKLRPEHYENF